MAAVAGLAALAVVLVQNVVGGTAERIADSSARKTAAQVAAQEVMRAADSDMQPEAADTFAGWVLYYSARCERIGITFADVDGLAVVANFAVGGATSGAMPVTAALVDTGNVRATTDTAAAADRAIAECRVP